MAADCYGLGSRHAALALQSLAGLRALHGAVPSHGVGMHGLGLHGEGPGPTPGAAAGEVLLQLARDTT